MSKSTKPEVSKKNEFYINKHRQYELYHFCLQYYIWKKHVDDIDSLVRQHIALGTNITNSDISKPTEKTAEARELYLKKMALVESSANETDPVIGFYIFEGVTKGLSYDELNARHRVPCCKSTYYKLYRKFFYILHMKRQ